MRMQRGGCGLILRSDKGQSDDSRSPAARFERRVAKVGYERRTSQDVAHNFALGADAAAVDDAQCPKSQAARFAQILFDDRFDIARRYAVQIEYIGDGDPDGGLVAHTNEKPGRGG